MPPAAPLAVLIWKEHTLMATRSRTTFQKRQKEIARAEKQRDKVARRLQRKLNGDHASDPDALAASDEENLVNGVSAVGGSSPDAADAGSAPQAPAASEAASAPAVPAAAAGRT